LATAEPADTGGTFLWLSMIKLLAGYLKDDCVISP